MNKTEATLSATTTLFAASTLYFAWQLGAERDRGVNFAAPSAPHTAATAPSARTGGDSATDGVAATSGTQAADQRKRIPGLSDQSVASGTKERRRPPPGLFRELTEQDFRRMFENPVTRRQLIEEQIPKLRDDYLKLGRRLAIGSDQWQRFLETLAEQAVDRRGVIATCGKDTECLKRSLTSGAYERDQQEIRDVLGESDARQYDTFNFSKSERQSVEALQARLPKFQQLSEAAGEDLIVALSEVRRDAQERITGDGGKYLTVRGEGVVVVYPRELRTLKERLAYASAQMAALRKRAGTLLNSTQLAAYDQMQGPALRSITRALQNQFKEAG